MKKITIAIDGHSSCGKSTMAKQLARRLGYVYVDTGAMYRCVTLYAMRHGLFRADGSIREAVGTLDMSRIPEDKRPDMPMPISMTSAWRRRYAHWKCRTTSALSPQYLLFVLQWLPSNSRWDREEVWSWMVETSAP